MTKRFELIVFDWDGTLMDSAAAIVAAIQSAAMDLGLAPPSEDRARHVIGLGLQDALHHAVPDLPEARYPEMADRYRHHYLAGDDELRLFDGVERMLGELMAEGYLLAVATGKSRIGLQRALVSSGLSDRFHATRCADQCFSKPHPQMLEELMAELGIAAGATLMIGDTTHDLQMAANAGVASVGVAFGAHDRTALMPLNPLYCAESTADLHQWLRKNA